MDGKVALVTGGGSGMGRATVLAFARAGAQVVVADVDTEAGRHAAAEAGGCFVETDVSRPEEAEAMVATAVERFGRLDFAVNNAALTPDRAGIVDTDLGEWHRLLAVNLTGVLLCLKYELAWLRRQGEGGAIVNVGSVRSLRAKAGSPAYTATKHGVLGLTRTAALEHASEGIRVNAVCPGAIDTPMAREARAARGESEAAMAARLSPLGRLGTAEEIAETNVWLCSPTCELITGQAIVADGGYLAQ
ncbi:SDR family oxidoreductase [Prauserella sp. PE36]|uniref:SDR family NAD(P)-dependent oxidoreductase n=1 Tax=Prauserella sp. PE36 TaxID=1504709 RepID=UPI000DE3E463|nr:glucose 1-dehydrogenase [Prauserella sp. PE36]RBM20934.1 SDR family oxidoreductase [Prauserella sp. PE36]